MKVRTLFARYGLSTYSNSFDRLTELMSRIGGFSWEVCIVDNALPSTYREVVSDTVTIYGGDNSRREFSGFDHLLSIPGILDDCDLINVVTAAFENPFNEFLPCINRGMLEFVLREDVVLAHIDAYPEPVRLFGRSFQTWACSKMLFARPHRIAALGRFSGPFQADELFSGDPAAPFHLDAPLSANYQSLLLKWLTGGDGECWHSAFALDHDTLPMFKAKAQAIMDEHSLSMRLRESGARLVDFFWLHIHGVAAPAATVPAEITQVRARNLFLYSTPLVEAGQDLRSYARPRSFESLFVATACEPFSATPPLVALWKGNRDFRRLFSLGNPLHCAAISLNQHIPLSDEQLEWLRQPSQEVVQDATLPITRGLHALYLARDDLRQSIHLSEQDGRERLVSWWMCEGRHTASVPDLLNMSVYVEPAADVDQDAPLPLTRGLRALWRARDDLRGNFDLSRRDGRAGLVGWWIREGFSDRVAAGLIGDDACCSPDSRYPDDVPLRLSRGLAAFCSTRSDLSQSFDLATSQGRSDLVSWWMLFGRTIPGLPPMFDLALLREPCPEVMDDAPLPITRGLFALYLARADLNQAFKISDAPGRLALVSWWMDEAWGKRSRAVPRDAWLQDPARLAEPAPSVVQDGVLPITRGLHALVLSRGDLSAEFDLATAGGRRALICWWMIDGRRDARYESLIPESVVMSPDPVLPQDAPLPLTRGLHALWLAREDLHAAHDLQTAEGRAGLIGWWMRDGRKDPHDSRLVAREELNTPAPALEQDTPLPLSRGVHALHAATSNLREAFDLSTVEGRRGIFVWWMETGFSSHGEAGCPLLLEPSPHLPQDVPLTLTRGLHAFHAMRPDLASAFDLESRHGRLSFIAWWMSCGRHKATPFAVLPAEAYSEPDPVLPQDQPLPLTRGLHTLWLSRGDLRDSFDIATPEGRQALLSWWVADGRRTALTSGLVAEQSCQQADPALPEDVPLPITRGMHQLWLSRNDLSGAFDLRTRQGREGFVGWWFSHGRTDPRLSALVDDAIYRQPDPAVAQDTPLPVTRGMTALLLSRADLRQAFDLTSADGRQEFVGWWVKDGVEDASNGVLLDEHLYEQPDPELTQDVPLALTRGLHALYLARPDLRAAFDLGSAEGRRGFVAWWMRDGRYQDRRIELVSDSAYDERDPTLTQDQPLPLTRGLHCLVLSRPDLAKAMNLSTQEGRRALVGWWMREARFDPGNGVLIPEHVYVEVDAAIPNEGPIPITRGLHAAWMGRADLMAALDPGTPGGRQDLVGWWFRDGRDDPRYADLVPAATCRAPDPQLVQDMPLPLTRGLHALWLSRQDLRQTFDLASAEGRRAFVEWWTLHGRQETANVGLMDARRHAGGEQLPTDFLPPCFRKSEIASPGMATAELPLPSGAGSYNGGGVNVVGFGRGELGIGEDVRMAVRALCTTESIDVCVPRLPLRIGARQMDGSLRGFETGLPVYACNLIYLPHYETVRLLATSRDAILGGRYNIGCWQWELPRFPRGLELTLGLVDEVWAASTFIAEATQAVTDKPVMVMPMAVALPARRRVFDRSYFGLPQAGFGFLVMLDGNSSVERKNPLAAIRAFREAFSASQRDVFLVVKAMNVGPGMPQWRQVADACGGDDRIHVLSGVLTREEVIGLHEVCDAFVSLHRAEGFGRNIAESMLLGKPVVVSDYSGSRDFATSETAFLVDGRTVPVDRRSYAFADGQEWWDADIGSAVQALRECHDDVDARLRKAQAGNCLVKQRHAPEAVGRVMLARLQAVV